MLVLSAKCFSQIAFPSFDTNALKFGLKNSSGDWILKPEYKSIQDFYDYQGNRIDTISIVQQEEYDKQRNSVLKNNYGLIHENGKIIIPIKYKSLVCNKGICAAGTDDGNTIILNLKNEKIAEIKGIPHKLKDSVIIVYNNENWQFYFTRVDKISLIGPFVNLEFVSKNRLYGRKSSQEKAFYTNEGNVYIKNDSIYDLHPELYNYDLFFIKNHNGITFSNPNGKLYDIYYQNVDPWKMTYCNRYINYGDYQSCPEGGVIDLKKVIEFYGLDSSVLSNTKDEDLDYDVLSTFSIDKFENREFQNYKIVQYKFLENKTKNYAVLDKERIILNSEFPIVHFFIDTALSQDPVSNKYFIVKKDKTTEVNQIDIEKLKNLGTISFNISFNSRNNVIKVSNDLKTNLFIINEKGNITEIKGKDMTNFYNGFAYINDDNKIFLINENLDKLKEISNINKAVFGSFTNFDNDGILIYDSYKNSESSRDQEFHGVLNYNGKTIIPESDNKVFKENPIFYFSYSSTQKDEEGQPKNFAFDKNGKKIDPKDKVNGILFSYNKNYLVIYYDYEYYFYNYSGIYLGSEKEGLNWERNKLRKPKF